MTVADSSGAGTPPLLLSVFPSFEVGGVQVRFAALANHFGPAFRHAVVAMDGRFGAAPLLSPQLDISYPSQTVRKGAVLGSALAFRRFLKAARPDVLVTSNWGTIEWALANVPRVARHVHIEDGFGPEERAAQIPRRVLTRRLALRRSTVVLPSRTLWTIAAQTWRLPRRNLRLVPNGVDLTRFPPRSWPPSAGEKGAVVGTVAALRPEKNIARLIRAFAQVPPGAARELVIAGDGPEREALERLAVDLGIAGRVRFLGHVADPSRLYGTFDVFAMSSDTEQMPLSLLEAMASSLPVAATDVGDVGTIVSDANRRFVVALDDAALARSIGALAADRSIREVAGRANRMLAERSYGQQAMFDAYRALFDPPRA